MFLNMSASILTGIGVVVAMIIPLRNYYRCRRGVCSQVVTSHDESLRNYYRCYSDVCSMVVTRYMARSREAECWWFIVKTALFTVVNISRQVLRRFVYHFKSAKQEGFDDFNSALLGMGADMLL